MPVRVDRNVVIGGVYNSGQAHEPTAHGYPTPLEFMLGYPYLLTPDDTRIAGGNLPTSSVDSEDVQVMLRTHAAGRLWRKLSGVNSTPLLTEERAVATVAAAGEGYVAVVPRGVLTTAAASGNLSDKPAMDLDMRDANRGWLAEFAALGRDLALDLADLDVTQVRTGDELFSVAATNHEALDPSGEVYTVGVPVCDEDVPAAPPAGALLEEVPPSVGEPPWPDWFSPGGGRLAYGNTIADAIDMATAFDEVADHGIDVLMTSTDPSQLATNCDHG